MNFRAAKSDYSDLATRQQVTRIWGLGNDLYFSPADTEAECQRVCGCGRDELSKDGARAFIGHLQSLTRTGEWRGKAIITLMQSAVCHFRTPRERNLDVYNALMRFPKQHRRWNGSEWIISVAHLDTLIQLAKRYQQAELIVGMEITDLKNATVESRSGAGQS